jgi:hypothetical protein
MMDNKEFILRKIPLKGLIDSLIEMYNEGATFIDIYGKTNSHQDVMGINIRDEYLMKKETLTEEDINQLLN